MLKEQFLHFCPWIRWIECLHAGLHVYVSILLRGHLPVGTVVQPTMRAAFVCCAVVSLTQTQLGPVPSAYFACTILQLLMCICSPVCTTLEDIAASVATLPRHEMELLDVPASLCCTTVTSLHLSCRVLSPGSLQDLAIWATLQPSSA